MLTDVGFMDGAEGGFKVTESELPRCHECGTTPAARNP